MSFCDVVPKEWVKSRASKFVRNPLGTGPYMMDHWTSSAELVLKRNPNWIDWRGVPQAPGSTASRFTFSINPQTALLKLKRGENDMLGDYIAAERLRERDARPGVEQAGRQRPGDRHRLPVHERHDEAVRQPQGARRRWRGRSTATSSSSSSPAPAAGSTRSIPPACPATSTGRTGVFDGYDPTKAKQLLTEAGYPNGFTTTLYSHNVDPWPKVIQSIQNDLAQIGIKAQVKVIDRATYWTLISLPNKTPIGLQDSWQDFPDPADFIVPGFSKSNAVPNGLNPSYWWSPQVEKPAGRELQHDRPGEARSPCSTRCSRRSWPTRRRCRCTSPT